MSEATMEPEAPRRKREKAAYIGARVLFHGKLLTQKGDAPYVAFITFIHDNGTVNLAGWESNGTPFRRYGVAAATNQDEPELRTWTWIPQEK